MSTNQQSDAINNLLVVQDLLGGLGFTLTSDNSYYKDYGLVDGTIMRLIPVFDKGISLDMAYKLVGFNITSTKYIPAVSDLHWSSVTGDVPAECKNDVSVIMRTIGSIDRKPLTENFMITAICSACNDEASSFFRVKGKDICVKCMGYDG